MPLNSSVDATTSFQSGQRFGTTRSSISARSCTGDEVAERLHVDRLDRRRALIQ